jgi:glycosyltransferase involved in cell wall biosynthesis
MGYPPNINAAEYLVKEILPIVRSTKPEIKLTLAGAEPHASVLGLKGNHVHVTGWVEDIRECYAKARIFIAPMQIGTGLQNKLLEAMSMKIPSITSPLANSALEAKDGEDILVGNSPQQFADHIIKLLNDKDFADTIAQKGYDFVHRNYDWNSATKKLEDVIIQSTPEG